MAIGRVYAERKMGQGQSPSNQHSDHDLSVIIPLYNEEENVSPLYKELHEVLQAADCDYELIFVDDGSHDRTLQNVRDVTASDRRTTIIVFRRNYGQTAALAAGIEHSRGRILVMMDGDMQNDPHDIPALLKKLDELPGYDVVSGWRRDRHDIWLTRRFPSRVANALIRYVTGVPLHDFGCTLKAYRREVLDDRALFSDLHRFLPVLAAWEGARVTEMVVNHRRRERGTTKYGLGRILNVLWDLVTVKFLGTYVTKPLYFFGKLGLLSLSLSAIALGVAIAQKYGHLGQPQGLHLNRNVLVALAALLCFCTVQCILLGIVSELLVRIYYESRGTRPYRIRTIHRADAVSESVS